MCQSSARRQPLRPHCAGRLRGSDYQIGQAGQVSESEMLFWRPQSMVSIDHQPLAQAPPKLQVQRQMGPTFPATVWTRVTMSKLHIFFAHNYAAGHTSHGATACYATTCQTERKTHPSPRICALPYYGFQVVCNILFERSVTFFRQNPQFWVPFFFFHSEKV